MRLIVLYFSLLFVSACIRTSKEKPEPRLSNQKLDGTWVVEKVNLYNVKEDSYMPISVSKVGEDNQFLHLYTFDADNNFVLDTGSLAVLKGTYKIEDSVLTLIGKDGYNSKLFLTAIKMEDTTVMRLFTDYKNSSSDKLIYQFGKVNNAIFDDVSWKTALPSTATDDEIKIRLKKLLQYYDVYFKLLGQSDSPVFNTNKIVAPIKLYSGGLGMCKPNEIRQDFKTLMGSESNALKAYKYLNKCFDSYFEYPERSNFLLEYAEVVRHLAKQL